MYRREKKDDRPVLVVRVNSIARTITKLKKVGGRLVSEKEQYGEWA
jgi:hypothetical protein